MTNLHVLVVPFPAQGHVLPLMELSLCLVKHGFRITFVNSETNHKLIMNALKKEDNIGDRVRLVWILDGLESDEDRKNPDRLVEAIWGIMARKLEELIEETKRAGDDEITCVVADHGMGSSLEIAAKMGIHRAFFCPTAATSLALRLSIPKLINDGIINNDGTLAKKQMIQLSPTIPAIDPKNFAWIRMVEPTMQKGMFNFVVRNNKAVELAEWLICNTAYDLEPATFALAADIIPIGPLLASNRLGNSAGNFWPEDPTYLKWLDQQPPCSVIYVAFGSLTIFNKQQFQELALGLELSNIPFLWIVRSYSTDSRNDVYPKGFLERVGTRGKIVGWAPQQQVLSHPSVACFLSHCGWNSTVEGVSNGVPFLCWPYFADQFLNESFVCDVWNVGLRFNRDKNGIIKREEIKIKIEQLFGDKSFRARALNLKALALNSVREGGSSYKNLQHFMEWLKT